MEREGGQIRVCGYISLYCILYFIICICSLFLPLSFSLLFVVRSHLIHSNLHGWWKDNIGDVEVCGTHVSSSTREGDGGPIESIAEGTLPVVQFNNGECIPIYPQKMGILVSIILTFILLSSSFSLQFQ
jgi:hypothetical protein